MRKTIVAGLMASLVMAGMGSAPAHAQYGPRDAKQMCKQAVRDRGAYDTSGVNVDSLGGSKYNVTGYAQRRGGSSWFTCRVNNGDVRRVDIDNWGGGSSGNNSGASTAAAVVGTAIVIGAIAAAASSDKRHSDYDRYDEYRHGTRPNYDQYSPAPGVVCYRWQRTCYKDGKGYAPNWTAREFGY